MWDKELVLDSREYLCIHEIPMLASPHPHPIPVASPPQPDQGLSDPPPQQPNHMEVPPEVKWMELDIPDFKDIPKDIVLDAEAWARDVLSYQFEVV